MCPHIQFSIRPNVVVGTFMTAKPVWQEAQGRWGVRKGLAEGGGVWGRSQGTWGERLGDEGRMLGLHRPPAVGMKLFSELGQISASTAIPICTHVHAGHPPPHPDNHLFPTQCLD